MIHQDDGTAVRIPPQIDGKVHPNVGLVTLTIGGNNAIFSKGVATCLAAGRCLGEAFPPQGLHEEATAKPVPIGATAYTSLQTGSTTSTAICGPATSTPASW
jgi:hypothetical protein